MSLSAVSRSSSLASSCSSLAKKAFVSSVATRSFASKGIPSFCPSKMPVIQRKLLAVIASGEKVRVSQTMAKYDWKDPLNLNSLLTEEERSVRSAHPPFPEILLGLTGFDVCVS